MVKLTHLTVLAKEGLAFMCFINCTLW